MTQAEKQAAHLRAQEYASLTGLYERDPRQFELTARESNLMWLAIGACADPEGFDSVIKQWREDWAKELELGK